VKRITVGLLSGGLDSCVAATIAKQAGDELYLLSFNWGQVFANELDNAQRISSILSPWEHMILDMKRYNKLSKSLLSDSLVMIPKGNINDHAKTIPADYPPGRDPTFLMIALSWLESIMLEQIANGENIKSGRVLIGTIKEDSMVYPDCNPKFYELLNEMLKISTKVGKELKIPITVQTPFINMTKKQVLAKGLEIGAPVEHTYSCHKGGEKLCGRCYPCRTIYFAFKDLGANNPFSYETIPEERYS
jgi:7-cyano-7-deazaguanine synthase